MPYKDTFVIGSAKTAKDLPTVYAKVKTDAKGYGFATVGAIKDAVVTKAMAEAKKPAEFVVNVQEVPGKGLIVDLVCEVKNKMSSVLARKEIKSIQELETAKSLAANADLKKKNKDMFMT